MEFISIEEELKAVVYSYCVTPSRLKTELKRKGFEYVKVRRNTLVRYICTNLKNRKQKITIKL